MRLNSNVALSTPRVLLVPYDRRHVPKYHEWMSDPAIQEATASEPLSLEEEYENQESWRESNDKLTFILCQPLVTCSEEPISAVDADRVDTPDKMIGDINFFLSPFGDDDDDDDDDAPDATGATECCCVGEVDIMIAGHCDRGKGLGKAAVSTFLYYILSNLDAVMGEFQYAPTGTVPGRKKLKLKLLMAKIKATNSHSIALFKGLGFEQKGDVNYFGEVKMVLKNFDHSHAARRPEGYRVVEYVRPAS